MGAELFWVFGLALMVAGGSKIIALLRETRDETKRIRLLLTDALYRDERAYSVVKEIADATATSGPQNSLYATKPRSEISAN